MWFPQKVHSRHELLEAGEAPCEPIGERFNFDAFSDFDDPSSIARILPRVSDSPLSPTSSLFPDESFKSDVESTPRITRTYLESIIKSLDSRDEAVRSAWLETLLDTIALLPVDLVNHDIVRLAQQKAQLHSSLSDRLTAAKLLGRVAQRRDACAAQQDVLATLLSLCQDVQAEVRAGACLQLGHACAVLDADPAPSLVPCLVELASDGDKRVRLAACSAVVHAMPSLPAESVVTALCMKLVESALATRDEVWLAMSHLYGPMCSHLPPTLRDEERRWFVDKYTEFAFVGGRHSQPMPDLVLTTQPSAQSCTESRFHCAFNFPAMVLFASQSGVGCTKLCPVLRELAADPCAAVRRTLAAGLHEVVGSLGVQLRPDLLALLRDESCEVLAGLIPHLGDTLTAMAEARAFQEYEESVCSALLHCAAMVARSLDWRLHQQLIEQLQCLPHVLSSDLIYTHFVALMFDLIHNARPRPVRLAACTTLLHLLRHNKSSSQRNEILRRINTELSQGRSCYSRLLFIKMAGSALDIFSKQYFKQHFCLALLDRAEDCVSNNRAAALSLFPRVRAAISSSREDARLLARLLAVVSRLAGDADEAARRRGLELQDRVHAAAAENKVDLEDARRLSEETLIDASLDEKPTLQHPSRSRPRSGLMGSEADRTRYNASGGPQVAPREVVRPSTPTVPPRSPSSDANLPSLEREFLRDAGIRLSRIPSLSLSDIGILTDKTQHGLQSKFNLSLNLNQPAEKTVQSRPRPEENRSFGSYLDKMNQSGQPKEESDASWNRGSYLEKMSRRSDQSWLRSKSEEANRRHSCAELESRLSTGGASRRHSAMFDLQSRLKPPGFTAKPRPSSSALDAAKPSSLNFDTPTSIARVRTATFNSASLNRIFSSASPMAMAHEGPSKLTAHIKQEMPEVSRAVPVYRTGTSSKSSQQENVPRPGNASQLSRQAQSKIMPPSKLGIPAPSKSSPNTRPVSPSSYKFLTNTEFRYSKTSARSQTGHAPSKTAPNSRPGSPTYSRNPPKSRPLSFNVSKTPMPASQSAATASRTTPNSRSTSPTRGGGRGFLGLRSADVGSRLPVRKK